MAEIDWQDRYRKSLNAQQPLRSAYARWYDSFFAVYNQNSAPWRSKVLDPKVSGKAKSVIAKVALSDPEPNFIPNDSHDFIKARNNETLVKNDLHNPLFDQPIFFKKNSVLTDAVVTGTGIALTPWTFCEHAFKTRILDKDGKVDMTKEKVKKVKLGYNDFMPFSVFRLYLQNGAQSFYGSRYVILEDFKDLDEVLEWADRKKGYKNLGDITAGSAEASQTRNFEQSRNRLLGLQNIVEDDQVHIWHCWDRVKRTYQIFTNAGDNEIFADSDMYWHGKFPMVPFYTVPRAHSPWGLGLFESNERLESANNSLINHFFDQLDLSLNGFMMRSNETTILYQDMQPGGEVVYDGPKPEMSAVEQPNAQGFQIARQIISEAIEENTISNYAEGVPRSANDKTAGTASGINSIQEAASDLVRFFEQSYAESCKQWYAQWMSNNQQFMDRERAVRILGENGYFPKIIKPEDIITAGQLDVEVDTDAMRPNSKEADRALKLAYVDKQLEIYTLSQQAAQQAAQTGQTVEALQINFFELSRALAESMGQKDFDRVIMPSSAQNDDPMAENDLMLMGKKLEPKPTDDHETHIKIHQKLLDDKGIEQEVTDNVKTHMAIHSMMLQQIQAEQKAAQEAQAEAQHQAEMQSLAAQEMETANAMDHPLSPANRMLNQPPLMPPTNGATPTQIGAPGQVSPYQTGVPATANRG